MTDLASGVESSQIWLMGRKTRTSVGAGELQLVRMSCLANSKPCSTQCKWEIQDQVFRSNDSRLFQKYSGVSQSG